MSYNVLVIPGDFTKDEHILKPLVEQLMGDAGKPNAVITAHDRLLSPDTYKTGIKVVSKTPSREAVQTGISLPSPIFALKASVANCPPEFPANSACVQFEP